MYYYPVHFGFNYNNSKYFLTTDPYDEGCRMSHGFCSVGCYSLHDLKNDPSAQNIWEILKQYKMWNVEWYSQQYIDENTPEDKLESAPVKKMVWELRFKEKKDAIWFKLNWTN